MTAKLIEAARDLLRFVDENEHRWIEPPMFVKVERKVVLDRFRAALAEAEREQKPSEDRVREAAEAAVDKLLMDGDRLAIKKRVAENVEDDLGGWGRNFARDRIANAIRPFVLPAPAQPADAVSVPRETFLRWLGGRDALPKYAELHSIMYPKPLPPAAPEPSAELLEQWDLEAAEWSRTRTLENRFSGQIGYVAARLSAWREAQAKGAG